MRGRISSSRWKQFSSRLEEEMQSGGLISLARKVTRRRLIRWGVALLAVALHYLPYAATFGLLAAWVKQFEKEGRVDLPAYFHALNAASGTSMSAFAAMAVASSSSGGAAAAGGGASGAG